MRTLETTVRRHLITLLLFSLLGGFVMLAIELFVTNHLDGIQNVAVIASIVGAVAIGAGFFVKGVVRHVTVLLLLALSLTGLLGAWEHLESRSGDEARTPAVLVANTNAYQPIANGIGGGLERTAQQEAGEENEAGERPARESDEGSTPPPLAPLSLSGLALMGAVVLLAKQDAPE